MNEIIKNLTFLDDGAESFIKLPVHEESCVKYRIRGLSRSRTGLKGMVVILYKDAILAHDTFYLGSNGPRKNLTADAQKPLGEDVKTFYATEQMRHDLDLLCLYVDQEWEASRVKTSQFDSNTVYLPVMQRVQNYVLDDGGTILYGREGGMKSYLCQIMGVCIRNDISSIWQVIQGPVLYINLERSEASFGRREHMIRQAVGVTGNSGVTYIHARGATLGHVIKKARRYVKNNPGCVVFVDSISRGAEGKLIDDDTANRFVNNMNSLETAWVAIGHSPKHSKDLFGSVHFKAGEDIGISVSAGKHDLSRGVCLEVTKANDILVPEPSYYALDFAPDGSGLIGIRRTVKDEFPDIDSEEKESDLDKLIAIIEAEGEATTQGASITLGIPPSKISRLLTKSGKFTQTRRAGHAVYYALADEFDQVEA